MKSIIAPTDFSDVSINAVNYAADMAAALNLNLIVLHATEADILSFSSENYFPEDDIEDRFTKLKKNLEERTGNKIKITFKQAPGIVENELQKICETKNPFAVVMATKGANVKVNFFIESITVYLSKHLTYPVVVVPKNTQFKPVDKILIATDLKDINKLPVEKITAAVQTFNARLHVLHVNVDDSKNENSAEAVALKSKLAHLNPVFHFLKSKTVQQGIFMFAENNNVDMIITFPKKHLFFHKSESRQVIFNSPITVMTIQ